MITRGCRCRKNKDKKNSQLNDMVEGYANECAAQKESHKVLITYG